MALRSVISSRIPTVVIVGATGTGKTKLGVELAQHFETEIISADSMQVYKGLDLVTAKATKQERESVPHHLVDILEPNQKFTVVDFRNRSLKIIDNLIERGKIPIIVGGTNYYIESIVYNILVEDTYETGTLLWEVSRRKRNFDESVQISDPVPAKKSDNDLITESEESVSKAIEEGTSGEESSKELTGASEEINREQLERDFFNEEKFSNEEIYEKLKTVDPAGAQRLHPNNRRKILRSIEVWLKSGRRHSEILAEQKETEGQLRRPGSTFILWLKCDQDVHDERLNTRVDDMLRDGLLQELLDFHEAHNKKRIEEGKLPDYSKGVFQTLGFKEFHEYLMMSDEEKQSEEGKYLLEQSILNMKTGTKRFARRQNKMVRGRFLEHPTRQVPSIFELDTTDLTKWDDEVKNKAIQIIESYLKGLPCPFEAMKPVIDDEKKKIDGNSRNYCNDCERIIIGDKTYEIHLKSTKHMNVVKKKNQAAKINN